MWDPTDLITTYVYDTNPPTNNAKYGKGVGLYVPRRNHNFEDKCPICKGGIYLCLLLLYIPTWLFRLIGLGIRGFTKWTLPEDMNNIRRVKSELKESYVPEYS